MAEAKFDFKSIFNIIVYLSLFSCFALMTILFYYVAIYNYAFVPSYDLSVNLVESGTIPDTIPAKVEELFLSTSVIVTYLDSLWLFMFIGSVMSLFYATYRTKREGYFSIFAYLTYGLFLLLWLSSVILKYTEWFKTLMLDEVMYGLTISLPFFSLYLQYMGEVHLVLFLICVFLNFVDFNNLKFNLRKEKEIEL